MASAKLQPQITKTIEKMRILLHPTNHLCIVKVYKPVTIGCHTLYMIRYVDAVAFKVRMLGLFFALASCRRSSRHRSSRNSIAEMDIKIPYSKSWYYGRQRPERQDSLTKGIRKITAGVKRRRAHDRLTSEALHETALKGSGVLRDVVKSYLGDRVKFRDEEVFMKEQMDDVLLYALSVLSQRERQQKDYSKREQEKERQYQREIDEAEDEKARKAAIQKKQYDYQLKQQEHDMAMQKSMATAAGATKPTAMESIASIFK